MLGGNKSPEQGTEEEGVGHCTDFRSNATKASWRNFNEQRLQSAVAKGCPKYPTFSFTFSTPPISSL